MSVGKRETSSIRETAKEYFLKHYLTLSLPSIILHILVRRVHCRSPDFHKCGLLELFLYEKCPYIHCCIRGQWGKPSPEKWGIFYSAIQILTRFSSGVAYGCTVSPLKSILILSAAIPLAFKASATLPARFSDSLLLMLGLPVPLSA